MVDYVGGAGNDVFVGTGDIDTAHGNGGNDTLSGNGANDQLYGENGNDRLDGGLGIDRMEGGAGDDVYFVDDIGDEVIEASGGGNDTIVSSISFSIQNRAIENLTVSAAPGLTYNEGIGNELNNVLTGVLDGNPTGVSLNGEGGNDLIYGSAGNDFLTGGDGDDTIYGGDGNGLDQIAGGEGNDRMYGGAGYDYYTVNDAGDMIFEAVGEGTDLAFIYTPSYVLTAGQEVEFIYAYALTPDETLNISGNEFGQTIYGSGNVTILNGLGGDDVLTGYTGTDTLNGGDGTDTLNGGDGNDILDGGTGGDTMTGGLGDDRYIVDNSLDRVIELDGEGTDSVESSVSFSLGSLTAVENLTLTGIGAINGTGNALSNILIGNSAANTLDGGLGDDQLDGGEGNDIVNGEAGNDAINGGYGDDIVSGGAGDDELTDLFGSNILNGETGNDRLFGGFDEDRLYGGDGADLIQGQDGNDILDGGAGIDVMVGGAGNDRYIVDNIDDRVEEFDYSQEGNGIDLVESSVTFSLSPVQTEGVENLILTGGAAINGTGNALNNNMRGNVAANTLYGGDGNDVLDGGAGGDRLYGGAGDDRYILDNSLDRVIELDGEGTDLVESAVSFSFSGLTALENLTLTGSAAINGTGNALANILIGNSAANILDGGAGADTMQGGLGNDTYYVDVAGDAVREGVGGGNDTVLVARSYALAAGQEIETLATANDAGTGFINLTGNEFANILRGNAGGNRLDGGLGADQMSGGLGNDIYVVDTLEDRVIELSGGGTDTIESSVIFSLRNAIEVENLTLTGAAAIHGEGNNLANILTGNAAANNLFGLVGNDTLYGGDGEDLLDGGLGADRLYGGAGNDRYIVDDSGDQVFEVKDGGTDIVESSVTFSLAGAAVENLTLTGTAAINGTGNDLANALRGNTGNNQLDGGLGADTLYGDAGNDMLLGGGGNDILTGGAGIDEMSGGGGDDHFHVDNAGDMVFETAGQGLDYVYTTLSYALAAGQEIEYFGITAVSGGADQPINLTGNDYGQAILGNAASNILSGLGGNDGLQGFDGSDTLYGGDGNDVLDGGLGGDRLYGGAGDDRYSLDNSLDRVIELDGEGTDTVESSVSFSFSGLTGLENLTLTGSAAINGTGNALNNVLIGNAAANILDGGAGIDTMQGGLGNDTYYVDVAGDAVLEGVGGGNDTVLVARSYALAAGQEIETLATANDAGTGFINLTGNEFANTLRGNAGVNRLDGGLGADQMVGGLGNDIYVVDNIGDQIVELSGGGTDTIESSVSFSLGNAPEVENLTLTGTAPTSAQGNGLANILTGNAGANLLQGGDGNDILDGGTGADWMHGGQGNDQYYIDDINDYILEQVNEGLDSVYSSITYSLLLADGAVEDLTLIGSAAINGTGNVLNNRITGNAAVNILDGGQGNDTLDGGAGADLLYGGGSDDRYIVDNSMDRVIEFANEGTDLVESSVSFSFSNLAELENLTLTGSAAINGTGNASGNFLTGNSAANILDGGLGSDTLTGLGGADTFVFGTALGASNVDTITDFVHGTDRIELDQSVFAGLGLGTLSASAFSNGPATNADQHILYDAATGTLSYDADGSGAGAAIIFATLANHPATITSADFLVVP